MTAHAQNGAGLARDSMLGAVIQEGLERLGTGHIRAGVVAIERQDGLALLGRPPAPEATGQRSSLRLPMPCQGIAGESVLVLLRSSVLAPCWPRDQSVYAELHGRHRHRITAGDIFLLPLLRVNQHPPYKRGPCVSALWSEPAENCTDRNVPVPFYAFKRPASNPVRICAARMPWLPRSRGRGHFPGRI